MDTSSDEPKSEEKLHYGKLSFPKLVAMLGGFLILVGVVLIGIAALAITPGFLDVRMLLERKNLLTFALVMVFVGLLDTCAAVIIARW